MSLTVQLLPQQRQVLIVAWVQEDALSFTGAVDSQEKQRLRNICPTLKAFSSPAFIWGCTVVHYHLAVSAAPLKAGLLFSGKAMTTGDAAAYTMYFGWVSGRW